MYVFVFSRGGCHVVERMNERLHNIVCSSCVFMVPCCVTLILALVGAQVSNTPFAAVTLSALYQLAADDGLCNSPYNMQRHPMRDQAYEGS